LTEFCGASLLAATKGGEVISGVVQKDPIDFGIEVLHANAYLLYSNRIRAKREEAEIAQKAKTLKRRLQSEPMATKNLSSMIRNHSAVTFLSCQAFKLTNLKTEGQDHSLQKNNSKRSIQSYDESRQLSSFVTKAMTLNVLVDD
jgi:hypothetical protein